MPLLIRGPVVAAGSTADSLVNCPDFMPTFLDLGGIAIPSYVDGTSLVPLLKGTVNDTDTVTDDWRNAILLEGHDVGHSERDYFAIRTADGLKYIEYRSGVEEFYDLASDPYEMNSNPSSAPAALVDRLQRLRSCAADTCRAIEREDTPAPPSVTSTVPSADATGVASTANVEATFSEEMMDTSINDKTFRLLLKVGTTTKIPATVSYDAHIDPLTATLDPNEPLQGGVTYKAVVTTGAKDLAGNPLDQNSSTTSLQQKAWLFTVTN